MSEGSGSSDQTMTNLANRGNRGERYWEYVLEYGGQFGGLISLIIIFGVTSPVFFTLGNFSNIILQSSIGLLLAVGQTFVILSAGIDLSNTAVLALTACASTQAMTQMGVHPLLGILIALIIGVGFGLVNGLIIAKGGIPDFIVTLGTMAVGFGTALIVAGGRTLYGLPPQIVWMGSGRIGLMPVAGIIALLVSGIGWVIQKYTLIGRQIYAVGGNAEAARLRGMNPTKIKITVYVFSGLTAAIAGLVLTGRLNSANGLMGQHWLLIAIAAVIIGGTNLFGGAGGIGGTIIGMLILGTLTNGLNLLNISPFLQRVVRGVIIITVVLYDQWRRRRTR